MRARTEVVIAVLALTALLSVAALIGKPQQESETESPPSTFLATPAGSRGLFEAALRLGVGVRRSRERPGALAGLADSTRRQLLVVLAPLEYPLTPAAMNGVLKFTGHGDLLLSGQMASTLMRCYGYEVRRAIPLRHNVDSLGLVTALMDSLRAFPPGGADAPGAPWIRRRLVPSALRVVVDSSRDMDANRFHCEVPAGLTADTLLVSSGQDLIALRLHLPGSGRRVILIADDELFRNRTLRRTDAGPFILGLFTGQYDQVIFEENHLGFTAAGSLPKAVWRWSLGSPIGWGVWQFAVTGMLMLLFGIARFGPVRPGIVRTRRSSLEHVRALATALSAARGHDEAIAAIVRGLRRRLTPAGMRTTGDWRDWLDELRRAPDSPRQTELWKELWTLTLPGQPSTSVGRAANLVEDLWQHLRP